LLPSQPQALVAETPRHSTAKLRVHSFMGHHLKLMAALQQRVTLEKKGCAATTAKTTTKTTTATMTTSC